MIRTINIIKNIVNEPIIETTTESGTYVIENLNEIGKEELFAIIIHKLNEVINKVNKEASV